MATGFMQRFKGKIQASVIYLSGLFYNSVQDGIIAHPGGLQANAVPLTKIINRIVTVTTAADSVILPSAVAGLELTVINAGANAAQVFGQTGDTIDGTAGATGYSQAAGKTVTYFAPANGAWHKQLSA